MLRCSLTGDIFKQYSTSLYCSATQHRCSPAKPIHEVEVGADATHHYSATEAATCLETRRVLFVGDSTTRHLFYAYTAIAGRPLVPKMRWKAGDYEPRHRWNWWSRTRSGNKSVWRPHTGYDRRGPCDVTHRCMRDEAMGPRGRAGYVAIKSNLEDDVSRTTRLLANGTWDTVVIQCPFWHYVESRAYDSTQTADARRAAITARTALPAGPLGFGAACADYFRLAQRLQPAAARFMLGHFSQPVSIERYGEASCRFEENLILELHTSLGVECRRTSAADSYEFVVASPATDVPSVTPIDRFTIVGPNGTYDGVHPGLGRQFALVQLLLNHVCSLAS